MASNSFGKIFKITTWGESHGKAIGVVIDGCPAGVAIHESEINAELSLRSPGRNAFTSPRQETDEVEILSGVYQGKTTGSPICLLIPNRDVDSSKYEQIKDLVRPGHANYTYLEKYGIFDYRGGGRSSARETVGRVAAGSVAKKLLNTFGIQVIAYIHQIGQVEARGDIHLTELEKLRKLTYESPIYCPDDQAAKKMMDLIEAAKAEGDSLGGVVSFAAIHLPIGLGDPVYEKLEARLAKAMLSIPASKGFEIGSGFKCAVMTGSQHNDLFVKDGARTRTRTNFAGGTLGGISNGMPLIGKVCFKPTSSIMLKQETLTTSGEQSSIQLPPGSRHDPCLAIRAVPIVEAMTAMVLADAVLYNRCVKI